MKDTNLDITLETVLGSEQLKIKIKNLKGVKLPEKVNNGDWIDLRAAEDVTIQEGEWMLIPLGIAMELPEGYEAHVVPRSSTFKKYGIIQTNHFGIIDNSYCGDNDEWMMPAFALRKAYIKKNERICQFRIVKTMPPVEFVEVESLGNKNRDGFGSTGYN